VDPIQTHALDFTVLEEAEKKPLHAQAHFTNFVQEDRAAVCLIEQAALVPVRPGEAAAHVAKQLRLEERIRHAGAIDGDEPALPLAAVVYEPGDDVFAHTAFAGDEYLGLRSRDIADLLCDFTEGVADAYK
jgi:hypothetical protein